MMNRCAGCGAEIDGDVCDARCETVAIEHKKWAGKEPCEKCEETRYEHEWEPATVGALCSEHAEQENEAAYERSLTAYYGGDTPTLTELQDSARKLK